MAVRRSCKFRNDNQCAGYLVSGAFLPPDSSPLPAFSSEGLAVSSTTSSADGSADGVKLSTAVLNNVMTVVEEIVHINTPIHFILEEVNVKLHEKFQRKFGGKKKKKRYPRSTERPTYTVLPPKKIRQKMGLPPIENKTNGKKAPHWRRAHTRILRSDRYRQKGKTIFVKACWIGPSEAKVGGKHYKVLLDK